MSGDYAASFLPIVLIPLLAVAAFTAMGLFFIYIQNES
ncbi:MAG: photosystem I reaction center subunit VIII [Cyanobacteria bacterium P01_F01_bin.150]